MNPLPDISPARWRDKFTVQPGELAPQPLDPAVPAILADLQAGRISPGMAAARLVRAGLTAAEAAALAEAQAPR